MAGSILNLWVQQQRTWGLTEKIFTLKKQKKTWQTEKIQTRPPKKTKEQNSKTEGNPGFELVLFLC